MDLKHPPPFISKIYKLSFTRYFVYNEKSLKKEKAIMGAEARGKYKGKGLYLTNDSRAEKIKKVYVC